MAIPSVNMLSNQPGGGMNVAMKANNALANENILRQINEIKKQYAPETTQADINSKNAYAALVGLQPLSNIYRNKMAYDNVPDATKAEMNNRFLKAGGVGEVPFPDQRNSNNSLNQAPQHYSGVGEPSSNSFSGWAKSAFRNLVGQPSQQSSNPMAQTYSGNQSQQGINPKVGNVMAGIAHVESGGAKNPYSLIGRDTGKGDHALGKYQVLASNVPEWTQEALGQKMTPQEFLSSPDAQEKVAQYMVNKHLQAGRSPQDIGSIWFTGKSLAEAGNVKDAYGTTPTQYVNKMNEGMNQNAGKTWAETTGAQQGIIKEGEKLGEIRATSKKELDQDYQQALQLKAPLDKIASIITKPAFQNLRNLPGFQSLQMDAKANIGSREEQDLIGKFQAAAQNVVAATVKGFGGRILASEIPLSESMKLSKKDTIGVMLGKLPVVQEFNEMTLQRSRIASQLMKKYHLDKGDALEEADKMVDGDTIRKKAERQLESPITDDDIETTAKEMGMTKEQVIKRLRDEGRYNG